MYVVSLEARCLYSRSGAAGGGGGGSAVGGGGGGSAVGGGGGGSAVGAGACGSGTAGDNWTAGGTWAAELSGARLVGVADVVAGAVVGNAAWSLD